MMEIKVELVYKVTDETIFTLFSDMNMGSAYWAKLGDRYPKDYHEGECLEEKLLNWVNDGNTFMIEDEDEETEYPINKQTITRGLRVMANVFPDHFNDALNGYDDATTGDVFLQCCCFPDEIERDRDLIYS